MADNIAGSNQNAENVNENFENKVKKRKRLNSLKIEETNVEKKMKTHRKLDKVNWITVCNQVSLQIKHKKLILTKDWLDSSIIQAAHCMLRRDFPAIEGFQKTTLSLSNPPMFTPVDNLFIQICHVGGNHWNVISGKISENTLIVNVYDSLHDELLQDNISIASSLNRRNSDQISTIKVKFHNVLKQKNKSDCGLYAIAYAKLLCSGKNPSEVIFNSALLRKHFLGLLEHSDQSFQDFPCKKRISFLKPIISYHEMVFCYCRRKESGEMIECPICCEWFHRKCLKRKGINDVDTLTFQCNRCKCYSDVVPID